MRKARVTSKGQITIPVELRRELGIEPGDTNLFVRSDGTTSIMKAQSAVDETAGAFRRYANGTALSARELREAAEESWAEEAESRAEHQE